MRSLRWRRTTVGTTRRHRSTHEASRWCTLPGLVNILTGLRANTLRTTWNPIAMDGPVETRAPPEEFRTPVLEDVGSAMPRVCPFLGAKAAPINVCRARETCSLCTLLSSSGVLGVLRLWCDVNSFASRSRFSVGVRVPTRFGARTITRKVSGRRTRAVLEVSTTPHSYRSYLCWCAPAVERQEKMDGTSNFGEKPTGSSSGPVHLWRLGS